MLGDESAQLLLMAPAGHEHVPGTGRSGSTGAGHEGRSSESISDYTVLLNNGVLSEPSFIYISPQVQTHINWTFPAILYLATDTKFFGSRASFRLDHSVH